LDKWPPLVFFSFMAGAYTAQLVRQLPAEGPIRSWPGWMLVDVLALAALVACLVNQWALSPCHLQTPFACVMLVLFCCRSKGVVVRVLEHRALTALGPLSYAAYCVQGVYLTYFRARWNVEHFLSVFWFLFLVWMTAGAIHSYIEKPLDRPIKKLLATLREVPTQHAEGSASRGEIAGGP
jgi:peptidoglycan/LPS O-acetylase OafA/YrhL